MITAGKYSVTQLSVETGFSRIKMKRLIRDHKIEPVESKPRGKGFTHYYHMQDIVRALTVGGGPTFTEAQTTLKVLQAEEQEIRNQRLRAELYEIGVLEGVLHTVVDQTVGFLEAVIPRIKTACPELSNTALDAVRGELSLIRDDLGAIRINAGDTEEES